jgi:serine/threonine protein kinase
MLGLRVAHSLGLVHGDLKSSNILFDVRHHIQVANFDPIRLKASRTKSGKIILFEMVFGGSAEGERSLPMDVRELVPNGIKVELWSASETKCSFCDIFETLKRDSLEV